jgi:hypothetical protein
VLTIEVQAFGTRPGVIHAQGGRWHKPHWAPIRDAFFQSGRSRQATPAPLTILTCNNGHPALGRFEKSLDHMGLDCMVTGAGIVPWINSRDKPRVLAAAARSVTTPYILYADSRDAILIQPPGIVLQRFLDHFSCDLLFGGDLLSFPPAAEMKRYEDELAGSESSPFKYLNAGAWIGRAQFVAEFFEAACQCDPWPGAPQSEQGIVRKLLPHYGRRIGIDYRCEIFFNIGFLVNPEKPYSRVDPFPEL